MPREDRYLIRLAWTVEARRGALRIPPSLDVGRKRKPAERSTFIAVHKLTKNCKFLTGQIAGLAVCLTANALESFPLNVLPTRWWNRRLEPSGCFKTSIVLNLPRSEALSPGRKTPGHGDKCNVLRERCFYLTGDSLNGIPVSWIYQKIEGSLALETL